mgnify:CR=1 FL=1
MLNFIALDSSGLTNAINEAYKLRSHSENHWLGLKLRILSVGKATWTAMDANMQQNITEYLGMTVHHHKVESAPIKRYLSDPSWSYTSESVLSMTDSIETAIAYGKDPAGTNTTVLSVTFGGTARGLWSLNLSPGTFFELFKRIHWHHSSEVCLPAKTEGLSEISDWRDLQIVVATATDAAMQWISDLRRVYESYAKRPAYAMPEPRPAILEAALLARDKVIFRTFLVQDICALLSGHDRRRFPSLRCIEPQAVSVQCRMLQGPISEAAFRACRSLSMLYMGEWHNGVEMHMANDLGDFLRTPRKRWSTHLPHGMHRGTQRFRQNTSANEPGQYCWATGDTNKQREPHATIHNFDNTSFAFKPGDHPREKGYRKVVMASGAFAARHKVAPFLYQHISKHYYASRHGYKYFLELSNKFVTYFYPSMVASSFESDNWYSNAVMSKVLMVMSTMYKHTDAEWVFFMDEDVHINAEWTHYPLDAWLEDVPEDKVFVHTNYRSLMSGAFFIRNSDEGRQFARDWVAVVMSGLVSCHGWDQAALEVLFFLRQVEGGAAKWTERPFDFDCMEAGLSFQGKNGTGCTVGKSFSCDYEFERKLQELGFFNYMGLQFFKQRFSSYSRGCANDAIRDFHVTVETASRPRLQCFHCTDTSEIGSAVWDGVLGGGNDMIHSGAIDSYFTDHKVDWLFHDQWLDPHACQRLDNFLPGCPKDAAFFDASGHSGRLWSFFDGYAYDFKEMQFCRVDEEHLKMQQKNTFMKEYPDAIAAAAKYSEDAWEAARVHQGGGESRVHCLDEVARGEQLWELEVCRSDGLKFPKKYESGYETWWILPQDYCSKCHEPSEGQDRVWPDKNDRRVVDCSHGSMTSADIMY